MIVIRQVSYPFNLGSLKPRNVKNCEHSIILIIGQKYVYWDIAN